MSMSDANNPVREVISSAAVEGAAVYGTSGARLGSIDDLMIDKDSGQVRYAVLEFGGFLGLGTDRYLIPWTVLKYSTEQGGYVVPLDKAKLDSAPRYSAPAGNRINRYYEHY